MRRFPFAAGILRGAPVCGGVGQAPTAAGHLGQQVQRRENTIASGGVLGHHHMAALLTASSLVFAKEPVVGAEDAVVGNVDGFVSVEVGIGDESRVA